MRTPGCGVALRDFLELGTVKGAPGLVTRLLSPAGMTDHGTALRWWICWCLRCGRESCKGTEVSGRKAVSASTGSRLGRGGRPGGS